MLQHSIVVVSTKFFFFIHNYLSYLNRLVLSSFIFFSAFSSSSAIALLQQRMIVGVLKHCSHNPVHASQHITSLRAVRYLTATRALLFRVCEFSSVLSSHLTLKSPTLHPAACINDHSTSSHGPSLPQAAYGRLMSGKVKANWWTPGKIESYW